MGRWTGGAALLVPSGRVCEVRLSGRGGLLGCFGGGLGVEGFVGIRSANGGAR
jgi:hypothetical protein